MGVVIYNHPKFVERWADRIEKIAEWFGDYPAQMWATRDMRFDSVTMVLLNRELQRRSEQRGKR